MRLKAYVLAADPNWIEASVLSYYDYVDEIVVSYDRSGFGWTGLPIPVDESLRRLRAIDTKLKCRFVGGDYYRPDHSPMENDTYQRQCAIDDIGNTADWILELDTDEIIPNPENFIKALATTPKDKTVVEWPMRVFFQRTRSGRFLEVTTFFRQQLSEYPGPVATRPGVRLEMARSANAAPHWRFGIHGEDYDAAMQRRFNPDAIVAKRDAILHFSWVRSEEDILRKVQGWSHSHEFDATMYVQKIWKAAPQKWPFMYNVHPLRPKTWRALWPVHLNYRLAK